MINMTTISTEECAKNWPVDDHQICTRGRGVTCNVSIFMSAEE